MGRKKEDRQAKSDHKKARQLKKEVAENGEDDSISLAHQLAPLDLQVREIPGDGNCLFRAVCDQLEGNCRNHLEYRINTVDYMQHFRSDFEPFVEDDVPFDRHTAELRKSGTFAGNDALVALARFLKISIVIHQAGQHVWQINGCPEDQVKVRQIHLSYHNGEHYNSVRRIGDHSSAPSTILCGKTVSTRRLENADNEKVIGKGGGGGVNAGDKSVYESALRPLKTNDRVEPYANGPPSSDETDAAVRPFRHSTAAIDEMDVLIEQVSNATGITDRSHIQRLLADHQFDVSSVIQFYAFTALRDDDTDSEDGSEKGSREHATKETIDDISATTALKARLSRPELARSKMKSTKEKRKEKREVKKARQSERNRRKLAEDESEVEIDDVHVLAQEIKCLDL